MMTKKTAKKPIIQLKKSTIAKLKKSDLQQARGGGRPELDPEGTHPNNCSQVVSCD
jgi:hypothetical protein